MPGWARTASRRAVQPADAERAERLPGRSGQLLLHQLPHHGHERRMSASGRRSRKGQSQLRGGLAGFGVEVPSHLEMVRHEARRAYDDRRSFLQRPAFAGDR